MYQCNDVYDPSQVRLVVDGLDITGFADGEKIKIEPVTKELYKSKVGVDGDVVFTKNNDNRHTVTIMLEPNSPSNIFLDGWMKSGLCADVALNNTGGGKYLGGGTNARVIERPTKDFGEEAANQEWKIMIPNYAGAHLP